jgi:hypothetical protein
MTLMTLSRQIPKTMETPSGTLEKREWVVLAINCLGEATEQMRSLKDLSDTHARRMHD